MKKCKCCQIEYSNADDNFHKSVRDGFNTICKTCKKDKDKKYYEINRDSIKNRTSEYYDAHKDERKEYYSKNKKHISEKHKKWLKDNIEDVREYSSKRYSKNKEHYDELNRQYHIKNKDRLNLKSIEYYYKNKSKIREYVRYKRKTDPLFKIRMNLNSRIRDAFKFNDRKKDLKTIDLLGCTIGQFRKHMESKFDSGMCWKNYGFRGWHIDHIKPCAAFDLIQEQEQRKCFHYTNLQTMWWDDNLRKQSLYNGKVIMRKQHDRS